MTTASLRGVGYCAHLTPAGDWAFALALDLARRHGVRLDIFFFPTPPTEPHATRGRHGELARLDDAERIEVEKRVRLYYDKLLEDYEEVGFRLCEGDEEPELRHCLLIRHEYDVLVLPYEGFLSRFGGRSIERFAESFTCPTFLVGPERQDQLFVNSAGTLWVERLGLGAMDWHPLSDVWVQIAPTGS